MRDLGTTEEFRPSAPVVVSFAATRPDVNLASILANTAAALAGADLNVLIIEPVADGDSVLTYFEPFLAGTTNALDDLTDDEARFVATLATGQVILYRHSPPVGRGKLNVLGPFRPFRRLAAGRPEFTPGAQIRAILRQQPYDVVLFGLLAADTQQARLVADVSDRVAICFPPTGERVREAVEGTARIVDASSLPRPLITVATPVRLGAPIADQQVVNGIRQSFDRFRGQLDERVVLMPEPTERRALTVLLEDSPTPSAMSLAYGDIARFVSGGRVETVPTPPPAVQDRHRRTLSPRRARRGEMRALIAYAPRDRPWADWAAEQLRRAGFTAGFWRVERSWLDEPIPCTLVILGSTAFGESPLAAEVVEYLRRAGDTGSDAVLARLESGHGDVYPATRLADLTSANEADAQRQLLAALGRARRYGEPDGPEPRHRFPRAGSVERASTVSMPRRTNVLVGRNEHLERTRDVLLASPGIGVMVLAGAPGVGKSAIAQEYGIRFGYDYDVVWWIPAADPQDIRASIAGLGFTMGIEPSTDMVDATLKTLQAARPGRTLLVYDGVADLDSLAGLVPTEGEGHVLITFVSDEAPEDGAPEDGEPAADRLSVGPLTAEESVALLRRYTPALPVEGAQQLVGVIERSPLSLHLAGALLRQFAARAETDLGHSASEAAGRSAARLAGEVPPGGSVEAILPITLRELPDLPFGWLTLRLAEVCCFLDHTRVGLALLRWPTMVEQLAQAIGADQAESLLDEPSDVDQALWLGQRLEIFSVFWGGHPELRLHGVVRDVLIGRMTLEEQDERRSQAARGLAGFGAGRSQDDEVMGELRPHLLPSGAIDSAEPAVRRWVMAQLRWLSTDDDAVALRRLLDLVERTYEKWIEGHDRADSLVLQLATWRADLQRRVGSPEQSLKNDRDLLAPAVERFGARSVRALTILRGTSGDLRGLGEFYEAQAYDERTWRRFRDLFGEDHPQSLTAAHNLAISHFLAGSPEKALARESDTLRRRIDLFGLDDPFTWWSLADTAAYHRELGRYGTATRQLYETLDRVRESRPSNHPDVLRVKTHLAVAERRQGRYAVALQLNSDAFNGYRHTLGPEHPRTRACQLSLAIDHYRLGELSDASRLAEENLEAYRSRLPAQHPFTEISRLNLALIEWAAGNRELARRHAGEAAAVLATRLDAVHPWVLAAQINVSGMEGDVSESRLVEIYGLCHEFLGAEHPFTLIAAVAARGGYRGAVPTPIDIDVPEV